jgi:hypothetical protein
MKYQIFFTELSGVTRGIFKVFFMQVLKIKGKRYSGIADIN